MNNNQKYGTMKPTYQPNGCHLEYAGRQIALVKTHGNTPPSVKPYADTEKMAKAGAAIASAFSVIKVAIESGERSTMVLEQIAAETLSRHNCLPSFKGYQPPFATEAFPFVSCISINADVVHGMPSEDKILVEGDLVTVDIGANYEGWHADSAVTYGVGVVSSGANNLLVVTKNALKEGIKKARSGNTIGDVSRAVYQYATRNGFRPAIGLTGHFIGERVHMDPSVPNVPPHASTHDVKLVVGMTFCIEPMLCIGSGEVEVMADGWTIRTKDGGLSAHFEHTIEVSADGAPARVLSRLAE